MTTENIKQIIAQGEGTEVEFKTATFDLPRSIYETICAFLNRKGGTILLGVEDDGTIVGVNEEAISRQMDTLAKDMNNSKIISPTSYLSTEVFDIEGKKIVYIYVPESSQAHSHNSIYYDRNQDGDFKIRNQNQITSLFIRKQESYTENKVFPYLDMSDFEEKQFDLVRKIVGLNRDKHPWANMTNEEILVSARMRQKDQHTGKEGYTLAAALLFGKENTLASVLPHYKTDALCRKVNTELYDDRDDIRCNLMQAYYRLMDFIHKHLSERPYIEGHQRISLREMIFREIVANLLIHREFSCAYPATLTIYKDVVVAENWSKPYVMGRIELDNLKPHPKNPVIANFFKQLGWVEELGSGVKKMFKYCPLYVDGSKPLIEDGDVFRITIQHSEDGDVGINSMDGGLSGGLNDDNGGLNGGLNEIVLSLINSNRNITVKEISDAANISLRKCERIIAELKEQGIIERQGSKKSGYWVVK